ASPARPSAGRARSGASPRPARAEERGPLVPGGRRRPLRRALVSSGQLHSPGLRELAAAAVHFPHYPVDHPTAARRALYSLVAPGGGYTNLSMDKEGRQVASWFNAMGVTAFVLKYRLGPRYHHPIELGDAQRAIRLVRSRAMEFGISPDRLGMMGFSAGGHLA